MDRKFRLLNADEIDVRVATANDNGVSLLLYKDARADMTILDETVGAENWQRRHTRDNANCIVSIWDSNKKQWIEKEDTGTESNTEKEKGLASDSFKRACTNWGIGRELYTAPFIWVEANLVDWLTKNGKKYPKTKFKVRDISYDNKGRIDNLVIVTDDYNPRIVYPREKVQLISNQLQRNKNMEKKPYYITSEQAARLDQLMVQYNDSQPPEKKINLTAMLKKHKVESVSRLTFDMANEWIKKFEGLVNG